MENRRDHTRISADVLRAAVGGARKTRIVYGANLNFAIVEPYLEELIGQGKLVQEGPLFYTTDKGHEHIRLVDMLMMADVMVEATRR